MVHGAAHDEEGEVGAHRLWRTTIAGSMPILLASSCAAPSALLSDAAAAGVQRTPAPSRVARWRRPYGRYDVLCWSSRRPSSSRSGRGLRVAVRLARDAVEAAAGVGGALHEARNVPSAIALSGAASSTDVVEQPRRPREHLPARCGDEAVVGDGRKSSRRLPAALKTAAHGSAARGRGRTSHGRDAPASVIMPTSRMPWPVSSPAS